MTRNPATDPWDAVVSLARERASDLDVRALADHAGYSPFHFSRLFVQRVGVAPGKFLVAARIGKARDLLLRHDGAVIDVATEVGFDSLSSFSRRFKQAVGVAPGRLRRLADTVADSPPTPFEMLRGLERVVQVDVEFPDGFSPRGDASVWLGWYPHPAPIGLPRAGVLVRGRTTVTLPLSDGAPFLLGFAVPAHADAVDHLAPRVPMVAAHPAPITAPCRVRLALRPGTRSQVPLLSALPSLCRRDE